MNDKEIKGLDDLRVWLDGYAMEFAPYNTPVFVSISGHNFCIERMEIQHGGHLDKAIIFKLGKEITTSDCIESLS